MRETCRRENVALRGARGQAGGGPDALDVPDHAGDFGVVSQAGKLRHQRNARAGGGGHGARARPTCADHHADGGQLIFRLHDRKSRFAVGADAVILHVFDQASASEEEGVIGIPGHNRDAGEHAAKGRGGVAVNDDLACGLVHALDEKGSRLGRLAAA